MHNRGRVHIAPGAHLAACVTVGEVRGSVSSSRISEVDGRRFGAASDPANRFQHSMVIWRQAQIALPNAFVQFAAFPRVDSAQCHHGSMLGIRALAFELLATSRAPCLQGS